MPDDHRSLFDVFKCRMDVGNSPPEFSDRCLAARAPEAQLDGKQQVLVAVSRNRPASVAHTVNCASRAEAKSRRILLLWS